MSYDADTLYAVLRTDLRAFIEKAFVTVVPGEIFRPNWHVDVLAYHLEEVARGNITRLIINIPPRHLKSIATSVALPAWLMGHDPKIKIICASYGETLAVKHSLDTRNVMCSEWYQHTFPRTILSNEKFTESHFSTTTHGFRMATSLGGSLTGFGGNLIIVDDPMKPADAASELERKRVQDWFNQTLLSRLDNKAKDAIIVIMQRLHEDDLTGHLLTQGGWTYLSIPAEAPYDLIYRTGPNHQDFHRFEGGAVIDPDREAKKVLESLRRSMGSRAFAAQYLQSPVPVEGSLFEWKWFKFYNHEELDNPFNFVFQSWDVASSDSETADFSVCTTWGVIGLDRFCLIDVRRFRCSFPHLIREALKLKEQYQPDGVLIESIGSGMPFYQQLRATLGLRVTSVTPREDKIVRAESITPILEQGKVFLPSQAPWLEAFRNEIMAFPRGKHDDQVDSVVQFLKCFRPLVNWVRNHGLCRRRGASVELSHPTLDVRLTLIGGHRRWRDLSEIDSFASRHFGHWQ